MQPNITTKSKGWLVDSPGPSSPLDKSDLAILSSRPIVIGNQAHTLFTVPVRVAPGVYMRMQALNLPMIERI